MSHINDDEMIYMTFLTQISSHKHKVYFCRGSKKHFFLPYAFSYETLIFQEGIFFLVYVMSRLAFAK